MKDQLSSFKHGYALLIGIAYWNGGSPLRGTLNDIQALYGHFTNPDKAAYQPNNIIVLQEKEATCDGIVKSLEALAAKTALDPQANVLIYYSGHGVKRDANYFLAPYDYVKGNFLQARVFAEKIAAIRAKKCLVMLDCCHSEGIPTEKNVDISNHFLNDLVQKLDYAFDQIPKEKNVNSDIHKGSGRVILTSCEAHEKSLDLGSNGLFTQVLLECLNGEQNIEKDGWVRLIDLIRFVPSNVAQRAINLQCEQHPMFKRIENLSSEDFIVCAYDAALSKGDSNTNKKVQRTNSKEDIFSLIDEGKFVEVFQQLDQFLIDRPFQYNRLKNEFSAGVRGIDLSDFVERLKVFIQQWK
ncbi:MAG: caspase family protein [Chitinophagaceae bacterium]